jgi:hypothetical protein
LAIDSRDAAILEQIILALDRVGGELDAADRIRGYEPWRAIARQEAEALRLAAGLSDRFRRTHPDLMRRLLACANLHLSWAVLRDEIEGRAEWDSGPDAAILDGGG